MTGSTRAGCDRVRPGRSGGVPARDAAGDRAAAAGAGHPSRSGDYYERARTPSAKRATGRWWLAAGSGV